MLEGGDGSLTGDGGKIVEEFGEGMTAFQIIEEVLEGNASAAKDGSAPQDLGIPYDHATVREHGLAPARRRSEEYTRGTKLGDRGPSDAFLSVWIWGKAVTGDPSCVRAGPSCVRAGWWERGEEEAGPSPRKMRGDSG